MGSMLPYNIHGSYGIHHLRIVESAVFIFFPGSCDILICHVCALDTDSDTRNSPVSQLLPYLSTGLNFVS